MIVVPAHPTAWVSAIAPTTATVSHPITRPTMADTVMKSDHDRDDDADHDARFAGVRPT